MFWLLVSTHAQVTVLLGIDAPVENDFVENIIIESAILSLEHRELDVVVLSTDAAPLFDDSRIVLESVAALAAEQAAEFTLVSRYEFVGEIVRLDFVWYDAGQSAITGRESTSGKIGLTLDRAVDRAVGKVLDSAGARIEEVRAASPNPHADSRNSAGQTAGVADTSGSSVSAAGEPAGGEASGVVDLQPDTRIRRKHVEAAAGFATFLAIGDSSDYITFGYNPTLDLTFRINLKKGGFFRSGINSGANIFRDRGLSLADNSLVVPIGLDFRYVFESDFFLGLFARISGGPAFFILQPPEDLVDVFNRDVLMKVVPYASAGLGLRVKLTHFMGIVVDMGYSVYLEDLPTLFFIMGFTPAATLYFSM